MFISLYYISCHQLRVYKDHFIINHDVFRKVYIYPKTLLNFSNSLETFSSKLFSIYHSQNYPQNVVFV